jgi:hypothetical protein
VRGCRLCVACVFYVSSNDGMGDGCVCWLAPHQNGIFSIFAVEFFFVQVIKHTFYY